MIFRLSELKLMMKLLNLTFKICAINVMYVYLIALITILVLVAPLSFVCLQTSLEFERWCLRVIGMAEFKLTGLSLPAAQAPPSEHRPCVPARLGAPSLSQWQAGQYVGPC